jgi:hypothetical protein
MGVPPVSGRASLHRRPSAVVSAFRWTEYTEYTEYTIKFPGGQAARRPGGKNFLFGGPELKIGASYKSGVPDSRYFVTAGPPPPEAVKQGKICSQPADKRLLERKSTKIRRNFQPLRKNFQLDKKTIQE